MRYRARGRPPSSLSQLLLDLAPDQLGEGVPLRRAQVRRRAVRVQVVRVVRELLLQLLQPRRGVRLQRLDGRGVGRVERRPVVVVPLVRWSRELVKGSW